MNFLDLTPMFRVIGRLCSQAARASLGERPLYLLPSLPCLLWASLLGGALAGYRGLGMYGFFLSTAHLPWFVLCFGLSTLLLVAGLGASHRLLGPQASIWVATLAAVPAVAPQIIFFGLHPMPQEEIFWGRYRTAVLLEWPGALISTELFGSDLAWLRRAIIEGVQPPVGFAVVETALLISTNLVLWYLVSAMAIRLVLKVTRCSKKL